MKEVNIMSLKNFSNNTNLFADLKVTNYISIYDVPVNTNIKFIGFFFNSKAEYPHYVLIDENGNGYSLPTHLNKKFDEIKEDKEAIEEIKSGRAIFNVYEYEKETKKKGKTVTNTYRSINLDVEEVADGNDELPFN